MSRDIAQINQEAKLRDQALVLNQTASEKARDAARGLPPRVFDTSGMTLKEIEEKIGKLKK